MKEIKGKNFFGMVYSGMTHVVSGNFAVLSDSDPNVVEQISLEDIFNYSKEVKFHGSLWLSTDAPYAGLWALEMATKPNVSNITGVMIDCGCDWTTEPEWLTYFFCYVDQKSPLWTQSRPIVWNSNFPSVLWADKTTTPVPRPNKLFEWVDY